MRRLLIYPLSFALLGFGLFLFFSQIRLQSVARVEAIDQGRVVVSAPLMLLIFGGDNYLAANLEVVRLAATGVDLGRLDINYLTRAQLEVARLNPCHEDNYYYANGFLAWSGSDDEGNEVLRRAMVCRFWDELPPFFYGFNQAFFRKNTVEASRALELAAQRATDNAAGFRKLAVMLQTESFADERLALNYLIQQRDSAHGDPKLQQMLDKRVIRLQGLVALRDAQRRFEAVSGPLPSLQRLVEDGFLAALPDDPLRLGYELIGGRINLKKLKVVGMEE